MARLLASDVQYELNRIPGGVWSKAFAEGRDMINFFGGIKPLPRGMGINDNGVLIPIYYSQNGSFTSYAEGDANPTPGHATKKYYTQSFKRYHGATGIDGLLQAIKDYQGYGLDAQSEIIFQMQDLMSKGFTEIDADLALDGSGNSGADVQGLWYHISDTGTWNGANKASVTHLQSYVDDNSGTDRSLTKALIDGVLDTMRTTRRAPITDIVMGDTAYHAYETLFGDEKQSVNKLVGDIYVPRYAIDGKLITRLPIDTNHIAFLNKADWALYYLPQPSFSQDNLRQSSGPWSVEQIGTGYDANDYVVRIYLTLVCKNPWGQAALKDVQ